MMSPFGMLVAGGHILMGLLGLGIFAVAAWGHVPGRRRAEGMALPRNIRLVMTVMGLIMVVAVWRYFFWMDG